MNQDDNNSYARASEELSDEELEDIQSKAEFARGEGVDGLAAISKYLTADPRMPTGLDRRAVE